MTKPETPWELCPCRRSFELGHSFVIRHSSFVISPNGHRDHSLLLAGFIPFRRNRSRSSVHRSGAAATSGKAKHARRHKAQRATAKARAFVCHSPAHHQYGGHSRLAIAHAETRLGVRSDGIFL